MSKVLERITSHSQGLPAGIPPMENGDTLTRAEFERRYSAMPYVKKAELIEGVVYMPSPVSHLRHGRPHALINAWLGVYWAETPGVEAGDNSSLRLDVDNEPQPDAFLFIQPGREGSVKFDDDGYIEGAPEIIVEIASSSVSYDLRQKLSVYRRNGVLEYVVWRVDDGAIDWFVWHDGSYEAAKPSEQGNYHSQVFAGLVLDVSAALVFDMKRVSDTQRAALHSPAHLELIQRLAAVK